MNPTRMRQLGMKQHKSNEPEVQTTVLAIAGMSCGACVRHVTRALDGMTGVVHVTVDLQTNEAAVEHLPAFVDAPSLIAAVRDAGYEARVARTVDDAVTTTGAEREAAACGCGRCGSGSKTAAGTWSNLGTGTIG
jgi:copper chaperone CopZ